MNACATLRHLHCTSSGHAGACWVRIVIAFVIASCTGELDGGSRDGLRGAVRDTAGDPVVGATVYLVPSDLIPTDPIANTDLEQEVSELSWHDAPARDAAHERHPEDGHPWSAPGQRAVPDWDLPLAKFTEPGTTLYYYDFNGDLAKPSWKLSAKPPSPPSIVSFTAKLTRTAVGGYFVDLTGVKGASGSVRYPVEMYYGGSTNSATWW